MAIGSSYSRAAIPRSARRRVAAMVATILVHAVLLLMILFGRGASTIVPTTPALAVFDVAVSPPPAPRPVPPPPVRERSHPNAGGSPGRAQTLPRAAMMKAPTPPPRAAMPVEEPPLVTPTGRPVTADLLALPDVAVGTGGGPERGGAGGRGDGRGSGTGTGSGNVIGLSRALWIRMPTVPEMEPYWPIRARRERIAGRVILACIVPRPGPPRRCSVIQEYPEGIGFGSSAVKMSRLFRMKLVTRGSAVEDLPVIVPVRFDVPIEIKLPAKAG